MYKNNPNQPVQTPHKLAISHRMANSESAIREHQSRITSLKMSISEPLINETEINRIRIRRAENELARTQESLKKILSDIIYN